MKRNAFKIMTNKTNNSVTGFHWEFLLQLWEGGSVGKLLYCKPERGKCHQTNWQSQLRIQHDYVIRCYIA